jgi:hypothetical protein
LGGDEMISNNFSFSGPKTAIETFQKDLRLSNPLETFQSVWMLFLGSYL